MYYKLYIYSYTYTCDIRYHTNSYIVRMCHFYKLRNALMIYIFDIYTSYFFTHLFAIIKAAQFFSNKI